MIEFFAGSGQMALQHLIIGCHVAAFDNKYKSSLTHDCLSPIGLGLWGDALTATHPGAVTWFGTKCSPYLNICFANHKRSARNEYFGDQSISWVVKSNEVQATTALLYFLSTLLNNNPMLEQPAESAMPKMYPMCTVLKFTGAIKTSVSLKKFGATSLKPLQIWHIDEAYTQIPSEEGQVLLPPEMMEPLANYYVDKNGKKRYNGKKRRMEQSEFYPAAFCAKVARISDMHGRLPD